MMCAGTCLADQSIQDVSSATRKQSECSPWRVVENNRLIALMTLRAPDRASKDESCLVSKGLVITEAAATPVTGNALTAEVPTTVQIRAEALTPGRLPVITPTDLQIVCWILGLFQ